MKLNFIKGRRLFYSALITTIILSIMPLLFIYFFFSNKYYNYIVDSIFEQQLNIGKNTSTLISNYFQELESSLFFASLIYSTTHNEVFVTTQIKKYRNYIENFIVARHGKIVFKDKKVSREEEKIIDSLLRMDGTKAVKYSDVYIDIDNMVPYIFVKLRVKDTDFIVKSNMDFIWEHLIKIKHKASQYIYILDKNYRLIGSSDVEKVFDKQFMIPVEIINMIRNRSVDGTTILKIKKERYFVSFAYVKNLDWYVVVFQKEKSVMSSLNQLRLILQIILGVTLIIIILALIYIFYRFNTRIQRFIASLQEISRGNFDKRMDKLYNDELGEIGKSINKMAEELKRNIHKIKDMELEKKKMEEMNRLKSEFFSMITHDLKTPLSALLGFVELFLRGSLGEVSEEQKEFLVYAKETINELIEMVNLILDIGKMEHGNFKFNFEEFNLYLVIKELVKKMAPIFDDKRISVKTEFDESFSGIIIGDQIQIKRVIMNLLNNAVKFSKPGGIIEIKVSKSKDRCIISVKDYGKGIPAEDINKIFNKYYQSSNTVKGGTGLGLTFVKLVVDAHKGNIQVDSNLGEYTVFKVELPLNEIREN